jgi:pimeloyl-ACP methyl ester carboxylesterase
MRRQPGYRGGRSRVATLGTALAAVVVVATSGVGTSGTTAPGSTSPRSKQASLLDASSTSALAAAVGARSMDASTTAACGSDGLSCTDVVVPLDRTGVVPGSITLHVESLAAEGTERGVMMLIAGGPGQGSATVFDIGDTDNAALYRALFPGYRIVAFDNRGTGKSGLLNCPALQRATGFAGQETIARDCATSIGSNRDFYGTHDHADDTDAVRVALGVDKLAMWGISYGTKLALAYALGYPTHVDRILLDSVLPTAYPDPYEANVLRDIPRALASYCGASACRAATSNYAGDVTTVANALAARPAVGTIRLPSGGTRKVRVGGLEMLSALVESDLNPGLAALLPAAIHAARTGDPVPLLRVHDLNVAGSAVSAEELSAGLNAATTCVDGHFPWDSVTPVADRPARYRAAVAALPRGSLGAFGSWAAGLGTASFCLAWPSPVRPISPLGPGSLPNVPVLAINGGYDMRTPTASAAEVISSFPQGRLLVVPAVGHSVVTADQSICALRAVRAWIDGRTVPATCARAPFIVAPVGAYPSTKPSTKPLSPRGTLVLARRTIHEATAIWLASGLGAGKPVAGLTSGRLVVGANRSFTLDHYGIAPGVELTGRLKVVGDGLPFSFEGTVTVSGTVASRGTLRLKKGLLSGKLGGRPVA